MIISYNASLFFLYYRIIFASILPHPSPAANLYRLRTATMRIIFAVDKIQAGTTDIIPTCALNVFLNAAINHQIRPSATWTLCNKLLHKVTIRIFSAGIIVGVDLLAKPLSSVGARQHSPDFPDLPASLLASPSSQGLCLPSRHANLLRIFPTCRRHCWRRLPRKVSILRRGTPICSGFSRLAGNLCRPRTAITAKSLTVMAGFF